MAPIVAEIVADAEYLPEVAERLLALDGPARPLSVAAGEDEAVLPLHRLDGRRFYLDRMAAGIGFLFVGSRGSFLFGLIRDRAWVVYISDVTEADADSIMRSIADIPVQFAFAGDLDELEFLNRLRLTLPYGTEEAWVGKNVKKYIPGIYWITVIPNHRIKDISALLGLADSNLELKIRRGTNNTSIKLRDRSTGWQDRTLAIEVAKLIDFPVFDKKLVIAQFKGNESFLEVSEKLEQWG